MACISRPCRPYASLWVRFIFLLRCGTGTAREDIEDDGGMCAYDLDANEVDVGYAPLTLVGPLVLGRNLSLLRNSG